MITVSGDPIQFVEDTFVLADDEIEIQDLTWENQGQGCADKLGEETDATIFGTDAGPSTDGKLSYVDITNYASVKLYGRAGDVVRLFINRAEYPDGEKYEFKVTIGEDGVGTFDLAEVYNQQEGAKYVHLNGVKTAQTWKGSPTGKAKVNHITVVIDIDAITAAYEADEADMNEIVTSYSQLITDAANDFPAFNEAHAEEFAALTTLVNGLSDALAEAAGQAMETGVYVGIQAQLVEATEALMSLSGEMTTALDAINNAAKADYDLLEDMYNLIAHILEDETGIYDELLEQAELLATQLTQWQNDIYDAINSAVTETAEYASPLDANELAQHEAAIKEFVEMAGIAAINSVNGNAKFYDLNGRQIQNPTKGQMIIKVANGSAVKVAL